MAAGNNGGVLAEECGALRFDILIADHVIVLAHRLEPGAHVAVVNEVESVETGSHVEDRSQAGAIEHAAAVAVRVVVRAPQFPVLAQEHLGLTKSEEAFVEVLDVVAVHPVMRVGVSHESCRGCDEGDRCCGFALLGTDEERDPAFIVIGAKTHCVEAATGPRRDSPGEVGLPATVVEIVVMEVDGAVLFRRKTPVQDRAVPVESGNAAGRQVNGGAVWSIPGDLSNNCPGHLLGKVPGEHVRIGSCGRTAFNDLLQGVGIENTSDQARPVDFAVVMSSRNDAVAVAGFDVSGHQ